MASPDPVGTPEQVAPPLISTPDHKASPELTAPSGWQKKIGSSKKGSTPSKRDVYFIAPDGEEIKTKRVLDRYLKSHPGGPASSEFDWSTGETPTRRSSRLSSKPRPSLDSPEGGSAEKRRKRKVDEDLPKDEDKGEPEESPAEIPPPNDEKKDEVMEDAEKCAEELPPAPYNGQEAVEVKKIESQSTDETIAEDTQVDSEQKAETITEVKTDTDNSAENKEAAKEEQNACESIAPLPKEDSSEPKESSDNISNVFQHCPEAPNASRQVDVST